MSVPAAAAAAEGGDCEAASSSQAASPLGATAKRNRFMVDKVASIDAAATLDVSYSRQRSEPTQAAPATAADSLRNSMSTSGFNTQSHAGGRDTPPNSDASLQSHPSRGRFAVESTTATLEMKPTETIVKLQSTGAAAELNTSAPRLVKFSIDNGESDSAAGLTTKLNETRNLKSFRNVETVERVPHLDHYRNVMSIEGAMVSRPTLAQLLEVDEPKAHSDVNLKDTMPDEQGLHSPNEERLEAFRPPDAAAPGAPKFGWIKGVFVRCLLNILGVMLYLRISWVSGQAGILLGSLIVLLSAVVTIVTTLSMCAIATNGDIKGGGCYFMISRSLGPEYGGAIGIVFAFANAVGAAMYVVGFAETVRDILRDFDTSIVDGAMWDVRIVGLITVSVLMCICLIGVTFEARMQMVLLGVLSVSIVNYWLGSALPVADKNRWRGITGVNLNVIKVNMVPSFQFGEGFFSVFAVFFPAATGIMAGANISGDLKNPSTAIPKGTLWAIGVTTGIYLSAVWITGATTLRHASGLEVDYATSLMQNDTPWWSWLPPCANKHNYTCNYGLLNSAQVMEKGSAWGPLITAGVFAATLSSALASLVSAPKIFQAVCKDKLFPHIEWFARGYGAADEPRRAYALSFIIAVMIILIGDLNAIAPLISNFFLASYTLINYSCFDSSFSDQPGFRPAFRYYNMYLSLLGAIICLAVMFVVSWWTALLTFLTIAVLFTYLRYRKPEVNWGSSSQAHTYKDALHAMNKLYYTEDHIKNFRPQVLVLTGNPVARPSLVDFAANITKDNSLLICGHVFVYTPSERIVASQQKMMRSVPQWFKRRKIKAFYEPIANLNRRNGVYSLLQSAGLGRLRPNIVMMGFKNDWRTAGIEALNEYHGMIQDAFDLNFSVAILRLPTGLDMSEMMLAHGVGDFPTLNIGDRKQLSKGIEAERQTSETSDMKSINYSTTGLTDRSQKSFENGSVPKRDDNEFHHLESITEREDAHLIETPDPTPERRVNKNVHVLQQPSDTDDDCFVLASERQPTSINPGFRSDQTVVWNFADCDVDTGETNDDFDMIDKQTDSPGVDADGQTSIVSNQHNNNNNDDATRTLADDADGRTGNASTAQSTWAAPARQHSTNTEHHSPDKLSLFKDRHMSSAQKELVATINQFQRRIKKAVIDVWWLYDDGGLSLLVPHLFTLAGSYLEGAKMRVFAIARSKNAMEQEQRHMAAMLSKFRIDYSDVFMIPDITRKPSASVRQEFERLIAPYRECADYPSAEAKDKVITDTELQAHQDKTDRQLRTRELLLHHSQDTATLIVLTFPVPRKGGASSALYMAWLDMLTSEMPPILLLRGNQQSVLTFYS